MTTNMKAQSPIKDAVWAPGRVRTAKEARELLESLRNAYRSLAPERRAEIKNYMCHLSEHQRRFGSAGIEIEGPLFEGSVSG
jgi:hypothetical protein